LWLRGLKGGLPFGFEFAVDGNKGVLIEAGIALEARFGVLMEAEDVEIVTEEAQTVFEGSH